LPDSFQPLELAHLLFGCLAHFNLVRKLAGARQDARFQLGIQSLEGRGMGTSPRVCVHQPVDQCNHQRANAGEEGQGDYAARPYQPKRTRRVDQPIPRHQRRKDRAGGTGPTSTDQGRDHDRGKEGEEREAFERRTEYEPHRYARRCQQHSQRKCGKPMASAPIAHTQPVHQPSPPSALSRYCVF
jgi:hypothetical protein